MITARTGRGAAEIARHRLSVPGSPSICDEHYPDHPGGNGPRQPRPRPRTEAEAAFLAIGDGAQRWLAEAAASGAARIRSKMARAVELAAVVGAGQVDAALGLAAIAGRFADGDLASIIDHLAAERAIGEVVIAGRGPLRPARHRRLGPPRHEGGGTMTLRQPHQDALLPAGDAARIRQVLAACSQLLSWAEANCGPAVRRGGAGHRPGRGPQPGSRRPGLRGEPGHRLLDFSDAARSAR